MQSNCITSWHYSKASEPTRGLKASEHSVQGLTFRGKVLRAPYFLSTPIFLYLCISTLPTKQALFRITLIQKERDYLHVENKADVIQEIVVYRFYTLNIFPYTSRISIRHYVHRFRIQTGRLN